jgi:hypothetical protein
LRSRLTSNDAQHVIGDSTRRVHARRDLRVRRNAHRSAIPITGQSTLTDRGTHRRLADRFRQSARSEPVDRRTSIASSIATHLPRWSTVSPAKSSNSKPSMPTTAKLAAYDAAPDEKKLAVLEGRPVA